MTAPIPTTEPTELRAGDTWKWTRSLSDYPASIWTLTYVLVQAAVQKSITASASGDDFSVSVAKATTAAYAEGLWSWVAQVANGTERYTVDSGSINVLPDLATKSTGYDARTHARIVLDAIEAVIENRASKDQERYMIAGRELWRTPIPMLLKLRQTYRAEVKAQALAEKIQSGTGVGGRIQFRT